MKREEIRKIAAYCQNNTPDEVSETLRTADEVCEKIFLFRRRWDMERTWIPVQFDGEIDWNHIPADDIEWPVMLSRHSYLLDVAYAYALTENEKYYSCFMQTVESFIDHAPLDTSPDHYTWRTLDTGIRAQVWVTAVKLMEGLHPFPTAFLNKLTESLKQHFTYLYHCFDDYHLLSNWGVLANTGALHIACFLQSRTNRCFSSEIKTLISRLTQQIEIQVLRDGDHWEQSPMYHHEVLWSYLSVILLGRIEHLELPPQLSEKTQDMCFATLYAAKPNHHQPLHCDSDDTDVRDILTFGAYLFSNEQLKSGAYEQIDFENTWRLGLEGIKSYETLCTRQPEKCSAAFTDSGNYYMRTGWGRDETYLHFRCGTLGSGHGHADLLHIDLFAKGEDILVDSGRYTYVNKPERTNLKASFAHNTVVMDGRPFTDCCASWRFGQVAKPIKGEFFDNKSYSFVSGGHLGYMQDGVFVRREVVLIKPDITVVFDSFFGIGEHTYCQNFHFNNKGTVTIAENGFLYQSNRVTARMYPLVSGGALSLEDSKFSRYYNHVEQNVCAKVEKSFCNGGAMLTLIAVQPTPELKVEKIPVTLALEGTTVSDDQAQAVRITDKDHTHIILFSREEVIGKVNLLVADGCKGYGEVMAFDKEKNLTVLCW